MFLCRLSRLHTATASSTTAARWKEITSVRNGEIHLNRLHPFNWFKFMFWFGWARVRVGRSVCSAESIHRTIRCGGTHTQGAERLSFRLHFLQMRISKAPTLLRRTAVTASTHTQTLRIVHFENDAFNYISLIFFSPFLHVNFKSDSRRSCSQTIRAKREISQGRKKNMNKFYKLRHVESSVGWAKPPEKVATQFWCFAKITKPRKCHSFSLCRTAVREMFTCMLWMPNTQRYRQRS